jgi:hypothetical protein
MRREEKRVRGGVAMVDALPPRKMGIRSRRGRGMAERSYRSTPGLSKYGLAGRAIITIAIATPANRDRTSITLNSLHACGSFCDRSNSARYQVDFSFAHRAALANRSCVRGATRASVEEVIQERCGKPI